MKKFYTIFVAFLAIHAFSQSGTLDTSFGNNGKVSTGFSDADSRANAVAVQPDGKIIAGGSAHTANTVNSWEMDTNNAVLVRYNADGSIDTSFGDEGLVMNDYYTVANSQGWNSDVLNIKVLDDGKILTYGGAYLGYGGLTVLARYNYDGSLDTAFGNNGHLSCVSSPIAGTNSFLIQPDGKIVVLGVQYLQPGNGVYISNFVVERFTEDGAIDTSFGTDGIVITSFGSGYNTPRAIALQSDGKIVAIGVTFDNKFALARYTVDGALDTTFDGDGKVMTSFGAGTYAWANFVSVHADGKILVAGTSWNFTGTTVTNFSLARYNVNGSLDTSFGTDGKATSPFDANDPSYNITSVAKQPDGKLLVTTSAYPYGSYDDPDDFVVRRYNSNATVDPSFGMNGKVSTTYQEGYNQAKMATFQPDGKIVVAGFSHPSLSEQNDFNVIRYESNGTLDTSFDSDGMVITAFDSTNDESSILLIQPDNKLIAIGTKRNFTSNGYFFRDIALSRYNSDGSPDASFGISGKVVSLFDTNINTPAHAILQADGKIVVANTYYTIPGDDLYHYELIRYTTTGSIDTSFGINGKVTLDAEATSLLSQPDGKIITTSLGYDSQNNTFLVLKRFNNNGTSDSSFDNDGIATLPGTYNSIATTAILQQDGKIIISTSSPNSNGVTGFATYRFNTDGSLDIDFETVITTVDNVCNAKAAFVQPDGKIIVAGKSMGYDGYEFYKFVAARYNSNGSLDITYGTNGILECDLGTFWTPYNLIQAIVLQPDGKFLVALTKPEQNPASPSPNSYDFVISRFDPNGDYDNDFGGDGQISTAFYGKYDEAFAMVLQPDNKIVVAGTTDTGINRDFALARYNNTITLDTPNQNVNPDLVILYPNPVKNILNLAGTDAAGIRQYSIFDMLGKVIYKGTGEELQVDTQNFSSGIYNVVITTEKGIVRRKFIKE
jgi:uncharacterized delta-60 repeat protein